MHRLIERFHRNERGVTATEYAMLVVFLALAIAVGATALAGGLNDLFSHVGSTLSGIPIPSP
jgi:Flp pilus assembly pilin Flp